MDSTNKFLIAVSVTAAITGVACVLSSLNSTDPQADSDDADDPYQLVMEEDFNGSMLNTTLWNTVGWNTSDYKRGYLRVQSGFAYFTAPLYKDGTKWGAKLQSHLSWTYGRFVVRARLPLVDRDIFETVITLHPAPPSYADKNAMQFTGTNGDLVVQGTLFDSQNYAFPPALNSVDAAHNFHTYTLDWTPSSVAIKTDEMPEEKHLIDRKLWSKIIPAPWDVPYVFQIFWGHFGVPYGPKNSWRTFAKPAAEIDYIRVYQKKSQQNL